MNQFLNALVLVALAAGACHATPNGNVSAVYDLINRVVPTSAAQLFELQLVTSNATIDSATLSDSIGGAVLIQSNTVSGLCMGVGWYLRHVANSSVSWTGIQNTIGTSLPPVGPKPITIKARVAWRYYFNERAHGYTTTYWTWDQWQYHLDWFVEPAAVHAFVCDRDVTLGVSGWLCTVSIWLTSRSAT